MIPLELASLIIGEQLTRDIYDIHGKLLLPKGTTITENYLQGLKKQNMNCVYVTSGGHDSGQSGSPTASPPSVVPLRQDVMLAAAFHATTDTVVDMMSRVSAGQVLTNKEIEMAVDCLFPEVIKANNILSSLKNLRNPDNYTYEHSVSVSALCIKIGQIMKYPEETLQNLGIAGLMHDLGKALITPEILNKPGPLNQEEFAEIRKHPVYSYRLVQEMNYTDRGIGLGVLQHHERHDGKGYPVGLPGDKIHPYAKIIACADVFDAITSDRTYRKRYTLFEAVEKIAGRESGYLDPTIIGRFIKYVLNFSTGTAVVLNTGEEAVIVMLHEEEPLRPLVQIGSRFVDLRTERGLQISSPL